MPNVTYRHQTFALEQGQTLLDAALVAGVDMPYSCQVGSCGTCKCILASGNIRPLVDFDYVLLPEEIEHGMILACQSTAKGDTHIIVTSPEA